MILKCILSSKIVETFKTHCLVSTVQNILFGRERRMNTCQSVTTNCRLMFFSRAGRGSNCAAHRHVGGRREHGQAPGHHESQPHRQG